MVELKKEQFVVGKELLYLCKRSFFIVINNILKIFQCLKKSVYVDFDLKDARAKFKKIRCFLLPKPKKNGINNKFFSRDYFSPGTLMIYENSFSNENYMFIVTGTRNNGKIQAITVRKNNVSLFLTNRLFWDRDFNAKFWKIYSTKKNIT